MCASPTTATTVLRRPPAVLDVSARAQRRERARNASRSAISAWCRGGTCNTGEGGWVIPVGASFPLAAGALKTPARNGYNAQGGNLNLQRRVLFLFPLWVNPSCLQWERGVGAWCRGVTCDTGEGGLFSARSVFSLSLVG